jgi:hypothetical protein
MPKDVDNASLGDLSLKAGQELLPASAIFLDAKLFESVGLRVAQEAK